MSDTITPTPKKRGRPSKADLAARAAAVAAEATSAPPPPRKAEHVANAPKPIAGLELAAEIPVPETVRRARRDIIEMRRTGATLTKAEVRYVVRYYYQQQNNRIRSANQSRALATQGAQHRLVDYLSESAETVERDIAESMRYYAEAHPVGQWLLAQHGIGPIIAAGILSHLSPIEQSPHVTSFWRFAGLDPTLEWNKGQVRPFNASLKVLAWKSGDSFVKFHNSDACVYGHIYAARKVQEVARNEAGLFAAQAAEKLRRYKIGKDTDAYAAYSVGKLPPAHLESRARRYAVKLFLSHAWQAHYMHLYGYEPELTWAHGPGGHTTAPIRPFLWERFPWMVAAYERGRAPTTPAPRQTDE